MNTQRIFLAGLLAAVSNAIGWAQTAGSGQKFMMLTPDVAHATLSDSHGKIPFTVKNISGESVSYVKDWGVIIHLMTTDDSGNVVSIEKFLSPVGTDRESVFGPRVLIMEPGATETYDCGFSMKALAFAAGKNKRIFGEISAQAGKQKFTARSEPFAIPPELARLPWDDLGKQSYLTIAVDTTKPNFLILREKHVARGLAWAILSFPIKITNTTKRPLLVNAEHVQFFKETGEKMAEPDLWEVIKGVGQVPGVGSNLLLLQPGESLDAGGKSYISMWNYLPDEWKQGDLLSAVVAGRIPETNKVFECYSAPFGFPAEPGGK